ncbi:MAG: ABC transporter permease [Bacteroidota bacterium]
MVTFIKVLNESISQALQQLFGNKLRSFLSLLGITIGIFCIIGVQAAVDSLEDNIRGSFEQLGSDVLYISKFPWADGTEAEFIRWMRRPNPSLDDYRVLKKRVSYAENMSFYVFTGGSTVKYRSSSVDRVMAMGASFEYADMFDLKFDKGRYFSQQEYRYGANKCIIGHTVAIELFGSIEPVGKYINLKGRKMEVIGVLEKSGEDLVGIMDFDDRLIMPLELARKFINFRTNAAFQNAFLAVKAAEGVPLEQLNDEVTGILRSQRRLKPRQEDNFAINELSMLTKAFDIFFGTLSTIGIFIGGFAILVGVFSVANIMFVSVKERTSIIGIKKALGAKRYILLLEFLVESIILCIIGGVLGLGLVTLTVSAISAAIDFDIYLSQGNIIRGVLLSVVIGIFSGIIPAIQAARMDPVEAIRSK